jgi:hypothetical protein
MGINITSMTETPLIHRVALPEERSVGNQSPLKIGVFRPFAEVAVNLDPYMPVFKELGAGVKLGETTIVTFLSGVYSTNRRPDGGEGSSIYTIGNVNLVVKKLGEDGVESSIELWEKEGPVNIEKSEIEVTETGGVIFSILNDDGRRRVISFEKREENIDNTSIKTGPFSYGRVTDNIISDAA